MGHGSSSEEVSLAGWRQRGEREWPKIRLEKQAGREQTVQDLKGRSKELGFGHDAIENHSRDLCEGSDVITVMFEKIASYIEDGPWSSKSRWEQLRDSARHEMMGA